MSVTTKKGDGGKTALYAGVIVKKSSAVIAFLGDLDELNSFLGWTRIKLSKSDSLKILSIQKDLFLLGSAVAGFTSDGEEIARIDTGLERLEREIAVLEKKGVASDGFIVPGNNETSARLHIARTVCRRCERSLTALTGYRKFLPYMNRLSDYLFLLALKNEE